MTDSFNGWLNEMTTTDLAKFGSRELREAAELLAAYCEGARPHDFDSEGVTVMFNLRSGMVFLTNSGYQVAVSDGCGNLDSFYTSPYEGHEGTLEDLRRDFDRDSWDLEDIEWLEALCLEVDEVAL